MPETGFVYDPVFLQHNTGPSHVERPQRLTAILQRLEETGLQARLVSIHPKPADRSLLQLAHSPQYLDRVDRDLAAGRGFLSTDPGGDTHLSPGTKGAALMAAGAVVAAVDAVMDGRVRNAFCCVRPPGHHATYNAGMGFCIYNNVAIGAQYARQRYGLQKILIIDWDVHHGNGTQDVFNEDPGVFFASSHQAGIYPGTGAYRDTGAGPGEGTVLNLPLAADTSEEDFVGVWSGLLPPLMEEFRPEFVFVSAGFDAHEEDLLGSMGMTAGGFAAMTRLALSLAHQYASDRLVSVLEGGYNTEALADSVEAHLREMMG